MTAMPFFFNHHLYSTFAGMNTPIKLKDALREMHQKMGMNRPESFQVSFYTVPTNLKEFKRVTLPVARIAPLPKGHRHKKYLIGIQPQVKGQHNYSVHTKLITEYNQQPVIP